METAIDIRRTGAQSIPEVCRLRQLCYWEDFYFLPRNVMSQSAEAQALAKWLEEDPGCNRLYGAFAGDRLIGYANAGWGQEPHEIAAGAVKAVELCNLFVARQWRGQGTGLLLLQAAAQDFARLGAEMLILSNWRSAASNGFYRALGGRLVGQQRRTYANGEQVVDFFAWQMDQLLHTLEQRVAPYLCGSAATDGLCKNGPTESGLR